MKFIKIPNKKEFLKKTYSISALVSFIVVLSQTYRSRGAFFYSDDFNFIAFWGRPWSDNFLLYNGHFLPGVTIIYSVIFSIFGINSYLPYLMLAGLCNFLLCISVGWYFQRRGFHSSFVLLVPALMIVVPFSAHTVFWPAAAINLLGPTLLFLYLTIENKRSRMILTVLFSIVGLSLGGYGLILLAGIFLSNVLRKSIQTSLLSALFLIIIVFVYSGSSDERSIKLNKPMLDWLVENFLNSINLFAQGTTIFLFDLFFLILSLSTVLLFMLVGLKKIKIKDPRPMEDLKIFVIIYISFLGLIWFAREGAETIYASRYVVITFVTLLAVFALAAKILDNVFKVQLKNVSLQTILFIVIIFTGLFRFSYWWQTPLDIGYQSSLNRAAVVQIICTKKIDLEKLSVISNQDGLMYLTNSLKSDLWKTFKKSNCKFLGHST